HDHQPDRHASDGTGPEPGPGPAPGRPLGSGLVRALTIADGRLELAERPIPEPAAGQVVVRVQGAGLNRADLLQVAGRYPPPAGAPADIPGLEFAGVVERVAADVSSPAIGDAVFGVVAGGAQAEYLAVAAAHCAPVPAGLDLVAMGGVPEAF